VKHDRFNCMLHSGVPGAKKQLKTPILGGIFCPAYRLFGLLLVVPCLISLPGKAQTSPSVVPLCEVLESPQKFDKQSLQLRGRVYLYFEEFSLHSEACPNKWPGIWLAFGGDVATPTMSTANDTTRPSGVIPKFGGVPIALEKDDNFERFSALISARHGHDPHFSGPLYRVTATLTGIFLAGNRKLRSDGKPEWPGYGHMGAFHLFVISRVDAVDAQPPPELGVSGTVTDADGKPVGGVDVYSQTVNCCQPWVSQARSDDAGHFAIRNAGQVVTFLKAGYSPRSLVLETGRHDVQLILESRPADDWQIPTCRASSTDRRFEGLPLSMVMLNGMHSKKIVSGSFVIRGKASYPLIRLFRGDPRTPYGETTSWLFGSEKFSQRNVLSAEGKTIGVDSRGVQENGNSWRVVVIPGQETVEYDGATRETSDIFDRIIDSACVQAQ
jgi:hypothetical protein